MFGFGLDESWSLSKELIEHAAECSLPYWNKVERKGRGAKEELYDLIDPTSARVEIPVEVETSVDVMDVLDRMNTQYLQHRPQPNGSSIAGCPVCFFGNHRHDFFAASSGGVPFGSPLLQYGARKGQTMTRAIAAVLRHHNVDEAIITQAVTFVGDAIAMDRSRTGTLVFSANPLDILMASEHASWTSCHGLSGEYQAGPQQYLQDEHTCIAYYYEAPKRYSRLGRELPYKLWRQMVYVDVERQSAVFSRHYGQELNQGVYDVLYQKVADLLSAYYEVEPEKIEASYDLESWDFYDQGQELGYHGDTPVAMIVLRDGKEPEIRLAHHTPCGCCGDYLDERDGLVCTSCAGGTRCSHCDNRIGEDDDSYTMPDDDVLCSSCFEDRGFCCASCGDAQYQNDAVECEDDYLCRHCANHNTVVCDSCNERFYDGNMTELDNGEFVCASCRQEETDRCSNCNGRYYNDDLHTYDARLYCHDCYKEASANEEISQAR